jgi:hypothetical protein
MLGDVVIVHESRDGAGEPFRLEAQRVAADFRTSPTTAPATAPTTRPARSDELLAMPSDLELKLVTADGGARFISRQVRFDASEMTFDPATETLTARGTEARPMLLYDNEGVSTGTVQEASWNTRTQQITVKDMRAQIRR